MTSSWWHSRHRETFHNYRRRMPSSEWFSHHLGGQERAWVSVERVLLVFSLLLGGHDCSVKCAIVLQSAPPTADSGRGCYRTGGSLPVALGENGSRPQRNLFPFFPSTLLLSSVPRLFHIYRSSSSGLQVWRRSTESSEFLDHYFLLYLWYRSSLNL